MHLSTITTWLHRRGGLYPHMLRLSIEGLDDAMEPKRIIDLPDDADPTLSDRHNNDQRGKDSVEEWKGKDNIYQGILWMKDKYEQYRDQADRRYELLKEELGRSERRYQDLLLSIEAAKNQHDPAEPNPTPIAGDTPAPDMTTSPSAPPAAE